MGSLILKDKATAKKKGTYALGALGGSVVLFALGTPILGGLALGGAGVLTYRWFMFRAKHGMRF